MAQQVFDMDQIEELVEQAARSVFADPSVRSVGIRGINDHQLRFVAVRNSLMVVPHSENLPKSIAGLPLEIKNTPGELEAYFRVPFNRPFSTTIVEQGRHRPMYLGVEVQNIDDDVRVGNIQNGVMNVGSVGCFVQLSDGSDGFLSCNHVIAGQNGATTGDRILQPGQNAYTPAAHCADLSRFVNLQTSPPGHTPSHPVNNHITWNEIDAAVAKLRASTGYSQQPHPSHGKPKIASAGTAAEDDIVYKVGRTTGLTRGRIDSVRQILGVPYGIGQCWFRKSMVIESLEEDEPFSDRGDSGAPIIRESDNAILGILYAGNGVQTYAYHIDPALSAFSCSLLP